MELSTVGVIGLGLLGRGICAALVGRGLHVVAVGLTDAEVDAARAEVLQGIHEMQAEGVIGPVDDETILACFHGSCSIESVAECDFVIESVTEDLAIKQEVMQQVEAVVSHDTPVVTNTSAIPIELLQSKCKNPERIMGMHWAEPAYATRFLELIRGEATGDDAFEKAVWLANKCEKQVSVVQRDVPGFIVNRIGYAMYREAAYLVETGVADPETIDRACRNAIGLWAPFCGPFRWIDISGGPALYAKAMTPVLPTLSSSKEPPAMLTEAARGDAESDSDRKGIYQCTPEEIEAWLERFRKHVWDTWRQGTESGEDQ
ncbi:3-hydroxyacyl-CoA dehydrogenase family protein [Aeoliella mucimassa]|uniref:Putative 3-hydroxybutyryl-CoA dehydrogenase n=1 Tax=Aeoliella mucimassa TaxID=2527972 RepID=A0A518AQ83_9BACT|nr:3-hydroxyacyl-CoA dehydrogenase family protein [Aeoliella mucimassa]QDU56878.1 putative 3-hydroxybutyryl-CoA dehydrogenase [Aeoliella mucimassa]